MVFLARRDIEGHTLVLAQALHNIQDRAVYIGIVLEPIGNERVDGAAVAERRQHRGQGVLQVTVTQDARVHHGTGRTGRPPEEGLLKGLPIDAQVPFNIRIPRPSALRLAVPAIDQDSVHVEEDLHRRPRYSTGSSRVAGQCAGGSDGMAATRARRSAASATEPVTNAARVAAGARRSRIWPSTSG